MLSSLQISRDGAPPAPEVPPPERTETPCGFSFNIEGLYALSNHRLKALGLGGISPLVVLEDGRPLTRQATRKNYEERCAGAANVGRNVVLFSPSTATPEAAADHRYALALSGDLPLTAAEGAVWWAYPETRMVARFPDDEGWAGHTLTLTLRARTPQNRVQTAPLLSAGGQQAPLTAAENNTLTASLIFTVPDGAWQAVIDVPAGGPYLIVESWLLTSSTGETLSLLQTPAPTLQATPEGEGRGIDLLAEGVASVEGKPPALEISTAEMAAVSPTVARLQSDALTSFSVARIRERLGLRYSPVEVLEDGKPLPEPNASCKKVKEHAQGRYCHSDAVVLLSASDGSDPLQNGRTYQLRLREARRFEDGWWLYPEDTLRSRPIPLPTETTHATLHLEAAAVTEGARLRIRLQDADRLLSEQTFDTMALEGGPVALNLPSPLPASLQLTATAEGGHFILTTARLTTP